MVVGGWEGRGGEGRGERGEEEGEEGVVAVVVGRSVGQLVAPPSRASAAQPAQLAAPRRQVAPRRPKRSTAYLPPRFW